MKNFLFPSLVALLAVNVSLLAASPSPAGGRPPTKHEAKVFDALDLSLPELAQVAAAIKAGNYDEATRELGAYIRGRQNILWRKKDAGPQRFDLEVADDGVKGRIQPSVEPQPHTFPDGKIDWFYNAAEQNPEWASSPEWQWQLNHMGWWNHLAGAYENTKDEKYARAWVSQMRSWVDQCPAPTVRTDGPRSAWRGIEVGQRMGHYWHRPFFTFLASPEFTDQDIVVYLGAILDHGRHLRKYQNTGNWLAFELEGLFSAGTFFPEFRESADWRAFAVERLTTQTGKQILPDGAQHELTPSYHIVAVDSFVAPLERAMLNGREGEFPPGYIKPLKAAYEFAALMSTPDGAFPLLNDCGPDFRVSRFLRRAAIFFPERKDFLWFATEGKEGAPPERTSAFFDWAGYAVMRSGWERDANYLVFDVGPLGNGHWHQDKLNLVLWAYGRELLFDSGGGTYENSKWREYAKSTASHNTGMVDGLEQNRPANPPQAGPGEDIADVRARHPAWVSQEPIQAGWVSTPAADFATGVYDGEYGAEQTKPASHRRSVLFLKPDLFVVADTFTPNDGKSHDYQIRWHLLPAVTKEDPAIQGLETIAVGKSNLLILPLHTDGLKSRTAVGQEEPEILGWNVFKNRNPTRVHATTLLQNRQGESTQSFLTLLLPLKKGEKNPVAKVTPGNPAVVTFADGRTLRVTVSRDGSYISAEETLADGKSGRSFTK